MGSTIFCSRFAATTLRQRALTALAAAFIGTFLGSTAWAQEAQPPSPPGPAGAALPAPAPTEAPPAPAPEGGPLGAVGNFIGKSFSDLTSGLKATGKAIDDVTAPARGTAKDAATAVGRLSSTSIVSGREQCVPAPNGAPDCAAAAGMLCRGKGYGGGRSLDTQTRTCLPQAADGSFGSFRLRDCVYVTRALCQ